MRDPFGRHDDVEATVAKVLQVGEPSTLVVSDEPPVLADVVFAENVVIDFARLFSIGLKSNTRFASSASTPQRQELLTWPTEDIRGPNDTSGFA